MLFRVTRYHAWWVLILVLLVTGAGMYYIQHLPLRSSFLDLLPRHDPLIDEYKQNEEYLAQNDYIALLVTLNNPAGKSTQEREALLLSAAKKIAGVLRTNPEFVNVTYLMEPSPKIPDQYLFLYQLNAEKLAHIEESVSFARQAISGGELPPLPAADLTGVYSGISQKFDQALTGPGGGLGSVSALDPQLTELITLNQGVIDAVARVDELPKVTAAVLNLTKLFTTNKNATIRTPGGFFSRDHTQLLMTIRPRYPIQRGVLYCTRVTRSLTTDLAAMNLKALGVSVSATGPYVFNAETNAVVNADMWRTTIISSIGVFIIFFFAFGSLFYSFVTLFPLVISLVLTMAWAKFAVGGFNLITSFLPSLVLGLGIDYGIHLIARYAEERQKGRSFNRALYTSILRKGDASLAAALTTSFVFIGLLFSRSRGLFEMGVITSVGVLIAFAVTIVLLPTLLTVTHYLFQFRHRERVINYAPHLSRYFRFVVGKGHAIFVIIIILTFFVSFQAAHTRFLFSSTDLIPHVKSQDVLNEILDNFSTGATHLGDYFTFFASSEKQLNTIVARLSQNNLVKSVESARDILPVNLAEQQRVLNNLNISAYIKQLAFLDKSLENQAAVSVQIRTLLAQFSLLQYAAALNGDENIAEKSRRIQLQLRSIQVDLKKMDVVGAHAKIMALESALHSLDQDLRQVRELPPIDTLLRDIIASLPAGIRSRYITANGEYIIRARVSPAIYQEQNLKKFNTFAATLSKHYFGMPLVIVELEHSMKRDFLLSTAIAAFLIAITLWRSMGGWVRAFVAGMPLLLGYIWMLAGMRLFGIAFNFINITISPLLIGVGVDNGIHFLHRYTEERELNPDSAIERSGQKVAVAEIVTSLTTMIVFGSLVIARTPGLRLLGDSALLGLGFTLLFSLLFLPAALRVFGKRV